MAEKYSTTIHVISYEDKDPSPSYLHLSSVIGVTSISFLDDHLYLTGNRVDGVVNLGVDNGVESRDLEELGTIRWVALHEYNIGGSKICQTTGY